MPALLFGAGYLGAALAQALLAGGHEVTGLDNGFSTDWPALERLAARYPSRFRLLRGDIRAAPDVAAAWKAATPVDAVYVLAAQASAHADAAPAEYTEETNLRGPRLIFEAALRQGRPPVVYASSFHVYGWPLAGDVEEARAYGSFRDLSHLSKVYAEKLGELFAGVHGLRVAPVRLGVVYGVGPVTKRDLRFVTVPHAFCLRALAGLPLEVHADRPIAFVRLDDAVAALRLAAAHLRDATRDGGIYAPANAAPEVATVATVAQLVQAAAAEHGLDVDVRGPASGAAEPAPFTVRTRLTALGWQPAGRLAETVPAIFDHYAALPEPAA